MDKPQALRVLSDELRREGRVGMYFNGRRWALIKRSQQEPSTAQVAVFDHAKRLELHKITPLRDCKRLAVLNLGPNREIG